MSTMYIKKPIQGNNFDGLLHYIAEKEEALLTKTKKMQQMK